MFPVRLAPLEHHEPGEHEVRKWGRDFVSIWQALLVFVHIPALLQWDLQTKPLMLPVIFRERGLFLLRKFQWALVFILNELSGAVLVRLKITQK